MSNTGSAPFSWISKQVCDRRKTRDDREIHAYGDAINKRVVHSLYESVKQFNHNENTIHVNVIVIPL